MPRQVSPAASCRSCPTLGVMNRIGDSLFHTHGNELLIQALVNASVKFVVIGGLAVAWHCTSRQADDMDLLVEPTEDNSARVAHALTMLGHSGFSSSSFAGPGIQVPLKKSFYAELLTPRETGPSYSTIEATAADAKLFNIPVRVASIAMLIQMKRQSAESAVNQAAKHRGDIILLEQHAAYAARARLTCTPKCQ